LQLVASADSAEGSVKVHADARLYVGLFDGLEHARLVLQPGRRAYVHLARGSVTVNGQRLAAGDAVKLTGESAIEITQGANAEVLVFDLA
jgi:redox-sensitive bicupin YhaK (pirin superfamily)